MNETTCENNNNINCVLRRKNSCLIAFVNIMLREFYEIYRLAFNEGDDFIYDWANAVIESIKSKLPDACKMISKMCGSGEEECPYTEDSDDIECALIYSHALLSTFLNKLGEYLELMCISGKNKPRNVIINQKMKKGAEDIRSLELESIEFNT